MVDKHLHSYDGSGFASQWLCDPDHFASSCNTGDDDEKIVLTPEGPREDQMSS